MDSRKSVVVSASFDNFASRQMRFLDEASRHGPVHVWLWPDEAVRRQTGTDPTFPLAERKYLIESIRYVDCVTVAPEFITGDVLPSEVVSPGSTWIVDHAAATPAKLAWCRSHGMDYRVLDSNELQGFPELPEKPSASARKRVIVTGCYDWFHSGHVRFFEEVSQLGELYVIVGHDANIRLLKGEGHPMFPQDERRYMAQGVRFVTRALVSSGDGWLDAEPEIYRLKPDIYAVNEDGDRPEKRQFCESHGLEYCVLKRTPKKGLPRRASTNLRGY
jgi:cytidyltransferase-like protein